MYRPVALPVDYHTMSTRVDNKRLVAAFSAAVRDATADEAASLVEEYYHDDAVWHGPAPIDRLDGREAITAGYWEPLLASFPDVQKDDYVLFGGAFEGAEWVCATGNLTGTFEADWLGIPATDGPVWIRYGEFHRIEDGRIAETRTLFDVLDVIRQAGFEVVPVLGEEVVIPGPSTHDGVLLDEADDDASERTLDLVEAMIFEGLHSYEEAGLEGMGMDDYWHDDFMWYGPAGIGTTRGIDGFQTYHQGPFLEAFPDRRGGNHVARFAEGHYCASTGWPSVTATHTGSGWLGLPATDRAVEMRVIDVWRREGDRLAENWVFIDLIDLLDQLGIDVFERLETHPRSLRR
jgi:predicted ester cyclase